MVRPVVTEPQFEVFLTLLPKRDQGREEEQCPVDKFYRLEAVTPLSGPVTVELLPEPEGLVPALPGPLG